MGGCGVVSRLEKLCIKAVNLPFNVSVSPSNVGCDAVLLSGGGRLNCFNVVFVFHFG